MDEPEIIIEESHLDPNDYRSDHFSAITFAIICFLIVSVMISKNQIKGILEDYDIKKLVVKKHIKKRI